MTDKTARRAEVKATAYVTKERVGGLKHTELAIVVDGTESLIITKSNAQDLVVQLKKAIRAVGL